MDNKILVVDDDISINELIKVNLELSGYKVLQAYDGIKGFALAKQELPSLVVLDVMMPEVDGFTVAKRIRENTQTQNIPIIMLTALSQIDDKANGFNIGVDDYLVKPFEIEELLMRVRALLKRTHQIPVSASTRELQTLGEITLLPEQYSVRIGDKQAKLTPIEFDILFLLASHPGKVFSTDEIFEKVWNEKVYEANNTVMVHIRRLRGKMKEDARENKIITTVWGVGYKIEK
jgi:DNA-binding response OmpR family regulator